VTLSDLAKSAMTRIIERSVCDSWASCSNKTVGNLCCGITSRECCWFCSNANRQEDCW